MVEELLTSKAIKNIFYITKVIHLNMEKLGDLAVSNVWSWELDELRSDMRNFNYAIHPYLSKSIEKHTIVSLLFEDFTTVNFVRDYFLAKAIDEAITFLKNVVAFLRSKKDREIEIAYNKPLLINNVPCYLFIVAESEIFFGVIEQIEDFITDNDIEKLYVNCSIHMVFKNKFDFPEVTIF